MRLYTDGDRRGIESEDGDSELIQAGADALDAGVRFAEAAGLVDGERDTDTCTQCGNDRSCRGLILETEDGEPYVAAVCAECQAGINERIMRAAAEGEASVQVAEAEVGDE